MPKLIDREATFRTKNIVSGTLGKTPSSGLPQLVLSLRADEIYDFDEKCWVPWDDVEEREITAFLVLIGNTENEIFHFKSVEKAFGWDGAGWPSLIAINLSDFGCQFRTEYGDEYKGKVTLQVAGIDHYDAEPGNRITPLDNTEVKDLSAKYATFFRKRSGEKKPKTVGKPTVPVVRPPQSVQAATVREADEAPPKKAAKLFKKPKKAKKAEGCTQTEAWTACKKAKHESISDQKLTDVWLKTVEDVAPDSDEDKLSPEGWANIRRIVVAQVIDDVPF